MKIRVWTYQPTVTSPRGQCQEYEQAATWHVDDYLRLELRTADGALVATYAPGKWAHVETRD